MTVKRDTDCSTVKKINEIKSKELFSDQKSEGTKKGKKSNLSVKSTLINLKSSWKTVREPLNLPL
jgi:hypothetical protein